MTWLVNLIPVLARPLALALAGALAAVVVLWPLSNEVSHKFCESLLNNNQARHQLPNN